MNRSLILLSCAIICVFAVRAVAASSASGPGNTVLLIGTDGEGHAHNAPADWPSAAGNWNGKVARYNPATRQLVFESFRADITGGSIASGDIRARGVKNYYQAGPQTGTDEVSGTTVLYIAGEDGNNPRCLGCTDVVDGQNGVQIYEAAPSANGTPAALVRKTGFAVYANQNKDLAAWYPDGKWVFVGVEMPKHALRHSIGNSAIGMFNDLWAISADGKIWVQLTDYARTWSFADSVAAIPFQSADNRNCVTGMQYVKGEPESKDGLFKRVFNPAAPQPPYGAYACSASNAPPPGIGTMRPTVGNLVNGMLVPIAWAERVGIDIKYSWAGPLQLATGNIAFSGGLPAIVNYERNLTPTSEHPDGRGLWSNPSGTTHIGSGYEPWAFSKDNTWLGVATDAFLSTSLPSVKQPVAPGSEAFTDVTVWRRSGQPQLLDATAYSRLYPYEPNGGPGDVKYYGHWEEPMVFSLGAGPQYIAFGSSANLDPPWDPLDHKKTFGLEVWALRSDGTRPAVRLTQFSGDRGGRKLAYPTAADPADNGLFITVVPSGQGGANPPGAIYKLPVSGL